MSIILDGDNLSLDEVVAVARRGTQVSLSPEAAKKVVEARAVVERLVEEKQVIYGVTTGVGELSNITISPREMELLQKNIIMSHAVGVGRPLPEDTVRAVMLLRANTWAKGYSGIRLDVVQKVIEMLNKRVHPVVPEKGSVGASGDLAPLAHIALAMIGEGEAIFRGQRLSGKEAMERAGVEPISSLRAKEGISFVNGTQVMTAIGALTLWDARRLTKTADLAAAMSLEALKATDTIFDEALHRLRPHPGQLISAENIRNLTRQSEIIASHKTCSKVQDPYSLRCVPQVHGASRNAIAYAREVIEIELNSATDNPLIFSDSNEVRAGGNFHGQPIALAMDFLGIALAELANISERRIAHLLDPHLSGLPGFLTEHGGLNSGLMLAQYTAASLVSENRVLAHPASVDSIPTSANQEDHVSMGTIAARKARDILENSETVIAIELLCAAQGLDCLRPLKPGIGSRRAYEVIREIIPRLDADRILYPDINKMVELIRGARLINSIEQAVGELH
ncbi:histidine ammonia-lyase [Dehalococcoidia bacterium]|nr:histidine ammonia-lyase [Dehalococcoidia bacterium]